MGYLKTSSLLFFLLTLILCNSSLEIQKKSLKKVYSSQKKISNSDKYVNYNPKNLEDTTELQSQRYSNSTYRTSEGSVIADIIFGTIFFFCAIPLLWCNERGYAYTKQFLSKWVKKCREINCFEVDPNNENMLVHTSGETITNDTIIDADFNLQVNQSVKMKRNCQMYQWKQTRHTRRISDSYEEVYYTYELQWMSEYEDSSKFHEPFGHINNQNDWQYQQKVFYANNVALGSFKLSEKQKELCQKEEIVFITNDTLSYLQNQLQYNSNNTNIQNPQYQSLPYQQQQNQPYQQQQNQPYQQQQNQPYQQNQYQSPNSVQSQNCRRAYLKENYIYFQYHPDYHSSGDFRVQFIKTQCGSTTVIAKQHQDTFETFHPGNEQHEELDFKDIHGCCSCCSATCKICRVLNASVDEINWVNEQIISKEDLFKLKLEEQETKIWLIRLGGYLLFAIGIYLMLSPIYSLLYWFPFVGRYLGSIGSFICLLIGLLVAIPLTLIVLGTAWVFYRKEIGIPLLLVSFGIIAYFAVSYQTGYQGDLQQQSFL